MISHIFLASSSVFTYFDERGRAIGEETQNDVRLMRDT